MDVSGSILASLDAGYPCRHDEKRIFSLSERREHYEYSFEIPYRSKSRINDLFANAELETV